MFKNYKNYGHDAEFFQKMNIYLHYVQFTRKNEHN